MLSELHLHESSYYETILELIISGILAENREKMLALKNLLFDESELSFQFKIDIFQLVIDKYYPELKNLVNRISH
jgi:hypothetical protein